MLRIWDVSDPRAPRLAGRAARDRRASVVGDRARRRPGGCSPPRSRSPTAAPASSCGICERGTCGSCARRGQFSDSLAFDPGARLLAVGESPGIDPDDRLRRRGAAGADARAREDATDGAVFSVAYSADGKTLAASDSGIVKLLDASSGRLIGTPFRGPGTYRVAFSPDGQLLAIADLARSRAAHRRRRARSRSAGRCRRSECPGAGERA